MAKQSKKAAEAEAAAEPTPIEKCKIMHEKGMDEDEIIGALAKFDGLGVMKAVGIYKKFQKAAGLILSKEDRVARIEEIISNAVTVVTEKDEDGDEIEVSNIDVKVAADALIKELSISAGAAKGHIRRYCKANDIEMPTRQQMAVAALEDYKPTVVNGIKAGKTKAAIIVDLVAFEKKDEEGNVISEPVDEKAAKRIYGRIAKAEGLQSARGGQDWSKVIPFLKEHGAEYVTKDGLANALVAELGEEVISLSAAKRVFNLFSFVKQFNAVDEAEDAGEDAGEAE